MAKLGYFSAEPKASVDGSYTKEILVAALGDAAVHKLEHEHAPTLAHMAGTGDLVALFLNWNGFPDEICEEGARHGGLHDIGKFRPDILTQISRTDDYGPEIRRWVTNEHCSEGARRLLIASITQPLLRGTAFTAQHHHSGIPDGYHRLAQQKLTDGWGWAHLTKISDVTHAIHLDTSRKYIAKREGRVLSPEDKFGIIMQARDGHDPVIRGNQVQTVPLVRHLLDI